MITAADLICLPYTPDLTQAGMAYALRRLAGPLPPQDASLTRLRLATAEKAAELAFRRCLPGRNVPHETRQAAPFSEPERWDVFLGGWRCELCCAWLSRERLVQRISQNPGLLLEEAALAPAGQQAANEPWAGHDLYLFAWVLGRASLGRAAKPGWLVHLLPTVWSRPAAWDGLGRLALKAEHPGPLSVALGGQAENRAFLTETVAIQPGERAWASQPFYSLAYLHAPALPEGRVGVYSPRLKRSCIVSPRRWDDLWLQGEEIILAGWMPRAEFLRRASFLAAGSRALGEACTPVPYLALPVAELYPLAELFARAKDWHHQPRK
jgi:hypothetical protein